MTTLNVKTHKFTTTYVPNYYYSSGTHNATSKQIILYYKSGNFRVKGELYYKTVREWKLYIESRHMTTFTKLKNAFLKYCGDIDEYEYSLFIDALKSMANGTRVYTPLCIYEIIDFALDFIAKYRDKLDKEILGCIGKLQDNKYVMIAWAAYYQQYRWYSARGYAWVTNNTIKIYGGLL